MDGWASKPTYMPTILGARGDTWKVYQHVSGKWAKLKYGFEVSVWIFAFRPRLLLMFGPPDEGNQISLIQSRQNSSSVDAHPVLGWFISSFHTLKVRLDGPNKRKPFSHTAVDPLHCLKYMHPICPLAVKQANRYHCNAFQFLINTVSFW